VWLCCKRTVDWGLATRLVEADRLAAEIQKTAELIASMKRGSIRNTKHLLGANRKYITELPGRGTNWLKQRYAFKQPALVGEEIKAAVEITRLRPERALVNLTVLISGPEGKIVFSGESLVLVKEMESK